MKAPRKLSPASREKRIRDLTPAQRAVFDRILLGDSAAQAAKALGISPFTVSNHTRVILNAFGVTQRTKLLAMFVVHPDVAA